MKPSIITIIILIFIIAVMIIAFIGREDAHLDNIIKFEDQIIYQDRRHLENLSGFVKNYNDLLADYNRLYRDYHRLAAGKGFYDGWEEYLCTAYTSLDPGCDSYSAIGLNIEKWSKYFNFCAFDPEGYIDYGDLVLVKFDIGISPFLAVDCGYLIKDNEEYRKLDLYFVNDQVSAYRFGQKILEVKVIK